MPVGEWAKFNDRSSKMICECVYIMHKAFQAFMYGKSTTFNCGPNKS